jgi:1L-myo-inositol 1-phosphate cytidylyltransferase
LLMSDHIFETKTAEALMRQPLAEDEVILAVDTKLDRIFDLDDATKVRCEGNHVVEIGKHLSRYNALDTGMFLCGPGLFSCLESVKENGDCSLSDGMRKLAQIGKLRAFDIGGGHWQDVDSPEALEHVERIFDRDFAGKQAESLVHA